MPNIKLRNFKGLYSNIDESDADQEYLREAVDIKIRPGQMSSESYIIQEFEEPKRWKYVEDDEEILHFEVVYIDNDKNANKLIGNKLISDYTRDLKAYYLLITYSNQTTVKLFRNNKLVFESSDNSLPKFTKIKVINDNGTVKIIANDTIYLLSQISRLRYPLQLNTKQRISFVEISDTYPVKIKTSIPHGLDTGDVIDIKDWDGKYKRVESFVEIKGIQEEWKPAKVTTKTAHYLKNDYEVLIEDWEGTVDPPGKPIGNLSPNGKWKIANVTEKTFTINTYVYSSVNNTGTVKWKLEGYNGPVPKSLNGEWEITRLNEYEFTIDNWIESSNVMGGFDVLYNDINTRISGFIFEELIPDINRASLGALSEIKSTGELQNIPVKIESLGLVSFGGNACDTFNFRFTREDENKTPVDMSIFQLVNGFEKGFDSNSNILIVQPFSSNYKVGEWLFPISADIYFNGKPALLLPANFFEKYFDYPNHDADKDVRWKIFASPKLVTRYGNPLKYFEASGVFYLVDPDLFTDGTKWYSKEGQLVDTVGFEKLSDKAEVIGTIINDYQDEWVAYYQMLDVPSSLSKYGITVSNIRTDLLPTRATAIAFYIRNKQTDDFQQIAYFDLCSGINKNLIAYGSTLTTNGIYLNQTIGMIYDTNRYELIRSVQDYKIVSGIPFIISSGNLVSGAIGSGNAMNIFYKQNIVPDVSDLNLTQLVDVNGTLGAADESSLHLITVTNTDGVLLYSKKDSLSYGISDPNHIIELPEGIVVYTKQGLFITNGYDKKLISGPINDIVEAGYDNGYVAYDSINEELYFSNGKRLFKYCSLYEYWSEVSNVPNGMIRISDDGEMVFADDKSLYRFIIGVGKAKVQTMKMDLGDPTVLKSLRSIVFDFIGKIWFNGKVLESEDSRSMIVKSFHVGTMNTIRIGINFEFTGTIYNISLNYDLQGEARLSKIYSNI